LGKGVKNSEHDQRLDFEVLNILTVVEVMSIDEIIKEHGDIGLNSY
jgi:hypothetical protein